MKVAVTGGAGFIGSHVVDLLVAQAAEVVVIDDLSAGLASNVNEKARFIQMDVRSPAILDLFAAERFDYVIHLAAQTAVPISQKNPDIDADVNIKGTINIAKASRDSGVKRMVFASSAAVYGDQMSLPVPEDAWANPLSFYGMSKWAAERYLLMFKQCFGLDCIILRYANVYGERQGDSGEGGVVSIFCRLVAQDKAVEVFGDGGQTRDFIYVKDVAAANIAALLAKAENAIYNVSTGSETAVKELIAALEAVAGQPVRRVMRPPREGDIYRSALSNFLAARDLGWQPRTTLTAGLARTLNYFRGKGKNTETRV